MRHVIADDLSGALEIAGVARVSGFRAMVMMDLNGSPPDHADVVVWCSGARVLSGEDLRERMAEVLGRIDFDTANTLYFKIDSTLRGPLAQMFHEVLHWSGEKRLLLTPANPATGRTVRGGTVFVDGVALCDSAFADDPVFPMCESAVSAILKPLSVGVIEHKHLQQAKDGMASGVGVEEPVVLAVDAESDLELDEVVSLASGFRLLAGSAGFFRALLCHGWGGVSLESATKCELTARGDRWLVINGSRHEASYEQVARLTCCRRVEVVEVAPGIAGLARAGLETEIEALAIRLAGAMQEMGGVCMQFAKSNDSIAADAALRLPGIVGRLVQRIDAMVGIDSFICSGGDTSGAVCAALGVREMEAVEELGPGCVWGVMRGDFQTRNVFIKPGGYEGENLLLEALNWLESCGK